MSDKSIVIRVDDLSDGNVVELLKLHRLEMLKHSPPESVHALDTDQLHAPNITFWSAYIDGDFAGCGALKDLGDGHGELKSMKTVPAYLRKGVAKALLLHITDQAKRRQFERLSLETGTQDVFLPARTLYQQLGFSRCAPFDTYQVDPLSVCMSRAI